jgi:hypothetical protein
MLHKMNYLHNFFEAFIYMARVYQIVSTQTNDSSGRFFDKFVISKLSHFC